MKYFKTYSLLAFGIVMLCFFIACEKEKVVTPEAGYTEGTLNLLNSYNINVTEPSGLSFGPGNKTLLTVSDNSNTIFETNLEGDIIRELDFEGSDLEGVTYNPDEDIIAVVDEQLREVIFVDYQSGQELSRYPIDIDANTDNKGLEGISYNKNNSAYYIVNEGDPGELVTWNTKFGIIEESILTFADDYSSVFVDCDNSLLWFLSDESRALYRCNYNTDVLEVFYLDISKYEGVVVDTDANKVYLVNDKIARLDIFSIENN